VPKKLGTFDVTTTAEVVVVGGGAVGLATTNALLRSGVRVVSVFPPVSEDRPAASRAAGAMLGAFGEIVSDDGGADDVSFKFRLQAQRLYPNWLGDVCERSDRTVFQAKGTFIAANNVGVSDRSSLHHMKRRADAVGEPAEYVDPQDVPGLNPGQYHAPGLCLYLPNEHSVDTDQLLDVLVASAGTFSTWTHVPDVATGIRSDQAGLTVATQGGNIIRAENVVLCAGSRSWEVLGDELREAIDLPEMYFGKGVSCVVRRGPSIPSTIRTPNRAFACGIHIVPRADGRLYLGATNNLGVDHDLERGVQPGELHSLFDEILHQLNTDIRESRIEDVRVGFRPILSHGRPIIGKTDLPGLYVGTGTYRDGVLMAPLIATIIAAEITGSNGWPNPFPVKSDSPIADPESLVEQGIRDIVGFLQEPRGELPYDRAEQLRKYVTVLFHMAIDEEGQHVIMRDEIRRRLRETPLNETMHKIFREVIEQAD
jgi:glycine/D-amino acid oxidase-like deaminating enzyme